MVLCFGSVTVTVLSIQGSFSCYRTVVTYMSRGCFHSSHHPVSGPGLCKKLERDPAGTADHRDFPLHVMLPTAEGGGRKRKGGMVRVTVLVFLSNLYRG